VPDSLTTFATNVKRARAASGLTQEALAERSGLHLTHIARIELAQREPGVRSVARLAAALGVDANTLFEGIDGR